MTSAACSAASKLRVAFALAGARSLPRRPHRARIKSARISAHATTSIPANTRPVLDRALVHDRSTEYVVEAMRDKSAWLRYPSRLAAPAGELSAHGFSEVIKNDLLWEKAWMLGCISYAHSIPAPYGKSFAASGSAQDDHGVASITKHFSIGHASSDKPRTVLVFTGKTGTLSRSVPVRLQPQSPSTSSCPAGLILLIVKAPRSQPNGNELPSIRIAALYCGNPEASFDRSDRELASMAVNPFPITPIKVLLQDDQDLAARHACARSAADRLPGDRGRQKASPDSPTAAFRPEYDWRKDTAQSYKLRHPATSGFNPRVDLEWTCSLP